MSLCRHFGVCGGCAYQDIADADYRALKLRSVSDALSRHGVEAVVGAVAEVPPATRRRATLKAARSAQGVLLGYHEMRSHDIVDLLECPVLTPALAAIIPGLREMLTAILRDGEEAELHLTDTDTGIDLSIACQRANSTATIAQFARSAEKLKLARIVSGADTAIMLAQPAVVLGKAKVMLPPGAFLQPTRGGEVALQRFVQETLSSAKRVVDLFAGCGTFALVLAESARVHAVEIDGPMLDALAGAARTTSGLKPVSVEKRNLFKRPLSETELGEFDAVCLDPPRSGALAQVQNLARSAIKRVAYVSCDAASFSRDARVMIEGGYRLTAVIPVDQFLWSSHIELVASFRRA
jgi:23S rRNA (uracil1939-C5)-methyltransferase